MGSIEPGTLGRWFDLLGAELVLYGRQWLDASQAEDVVQDVFIRLMQQQPPPENVKAWLYVAVRNEAFSQLRRRQRQQRHAEQIQADQPAWFQTEPEQQLDGQIAQTALCALSADLREVIVLRIWGGLTLKEIGAVLGLPVSTVFNQYQSALRQLRQRIDTPCPTKTN